MSNKENKDKKKISSMQAWHIVKFYILDNRRQAPSFVRENYYEKAGKQIWKITVLVYDELLENPQKREETFTIKTDPENDDDYILAVGSGIRGKISDIYE